jgi:hypothetical protein
VPHRRPPASTEKSTPASFRRRYDDLESRRTKLIERHAALGESARRHAGYRHALKLLNDTFRKSSVAQRLAVLEAAAWLIKILEKTIINT